MDAPGIRAFLLVRGIAVRQGLRFLHTELLGILAKRSDVLSPRMMRIIGEPGGRLAPAWAAISRRRHIGWRRLRPCNGAPAETA
jgi:hypothetical protein